MNNENCDYQKVRQFVEARPYIPTADKMRELLDLENIDHSTVNIEALMAISRLIVMSEGGMFNKLVDPRSVEQDDEQIRGLMKRIRDVIHRYDFKIFTPGSVSITRGNDGDFFNTAPREADIEVCFSPAKVCLSAPSFLRSLKDRMVDDANLGKLLEHTAGLSFDRSMPTAKGGPVDPYAFYHFVDQPCWDVEEWWADDEKSKKKRIKNKRRRRAAKARRKSKH